MSSSMSCRLRDASKHFDAVAGIYAIVNTVNDKFYIGSSTSLKKRAYNHHNLLKLNAHPNVILQRSWQKHGESAFDFVMLELVEDESELLDAEQWWIDNANATVNGYNISPTAANRLGSKCSEESKRKMSDAQRGRKLSPERIEQIRIASTGRKHTDEAKRKMSESISAKGKSPEHIALIVARNKSRAGVKASEETKAKMRAAHAGRKGIPHTDESKKKIREARAKQEMSKEQIEKMCSAIRGKKQSPEHIAKRVATFKKNREGTKNE